MASVSRQLVLYRPTMHHGYNPEGMNLKALREVVEKIGYRGAGGAVKPC
jgi:hypothetical protein